MNVKCLININAVAKGVKLVIILSIINHVSIPKTSHINCCFLTH